MDPDGLFKRRHESNCNTLPTMFREHRHSLRIGMIWKETIARAPHSHVACEGEEGAALTDRRAHLLDRLGQGSARRHKPSAILLKRDLHDPTHLAGLLDAHPSNRDVHHLL